MKVMCIKRGEWVSEMVGVSKKCNPSFGEVCTVIGEYGDNYVLSEYPLNEVGFNQSFSKKSFIPLSNIDGTELVNKREETLASL